MLLKTLRGGGRGSFYQRKHNNLSTLFSAMLLWSSLTSQHHAHHNSIARQGSSPQQNYRKSTNGLNTKYISIQDLLHFGFRAQRNPPNEKVIRYRNTLAAAGHIT